MIVYIDITIPRGKSEDVVTIVFNAKFISFCKGRLRSKSGKGEGRDDGEVALKRENRIERKNKGTVRGKRVSGHREVGNKTVRTRIHFHKAKVIKRCERDYKQARGCRATEFEIGLNL